MVLFQQSVEGKIEPYDPTIHMLGAENRESVTCYLDALLFAMFARLGSFEPILFTTFEDEPRRRLSTLIRLWVNMLRTGRLIRTDVVSGEATGELKSNENVDQVSPRSAGSMWLVGRGTHSATRHIGSIQLHHRGTSNAASYTEDGHIPYRCRRR